MWSIRAPGGARANTIEKISESWERRASVRKFSIGSEDRFDPTIPEFPADILPFSTHWSFQSADPAVRDKILACAWLSYNATTIDIERHVLAPACLSVFDKASDAQLRSVIAQTMTDEAYHIWLTSESSEITRRNRRLEDIQLPTSNIVGRMRSFQSAQSEAWKQDLVAVCTAIVTEMVICSHLRRIANATDIQPLNAASTRAHLLDEQAHNGIFRAIAHHIWADLTPSERTFFVTASLESPKWFAHHEFEVWAAMLKQIGFQHSDALVGDCLCQTSHVDDAPIRELLLELDADLPEPIQPACTRD